MFFRAGGIRFIADILPHLSERYHVDFYVAGPEDDIFEYKGARVHIVRSRQIPFTDKRFLPSLDVDADVYIFLDYAAALSRNGGERNLVIMHHLAQSFYDENPWLYRKYFGRIGMRYLSVERFLLRRVKNKTSTALAVSDVSVPYLMRLGFDVRVVGNGIDVGRYRPGEKEEFAVVVGRLVNYKRVEWALDVARRTGIPVKVIGTGPLERYLREVAPENVEFLGYVPEEDKVDILSRAKYLLAFSAFEGFDIPVIEAMASGAVPVMSDIRAHRFILAGRRAGVLVKSLDDAVKAVQRLERNPGEWQVLSFAGRSLVEELWSAEVVAQKYVKVIEGLLGG